MKAQYNFKYDGKINSSLENQFNEQQNFPNNLKLLNISRNNFFNKDSGKILNIDYIPKELFSSNMIKNKKENKDDKVVINYTQNPFNFESNNFKRSCLDDKNNDLKSSKKNENNDDFKISQNEFNKSESYNKDNNILSSDINCNKNQNMNSNLHLPGNISKETNSNQRYNEEINQSISKNKNINNINSNVLSNESSTLRQNLSNYNGLSDNFITSHLEISNTLTNNSNFLSSQNNYLEKVKLRELDDKEKFLFELEAKRNKNISDLIEKQKIEFSKKVKDIEDMNKITKENFLIENNSKQKSKNFDKNCNNIICNNENISIKKEENVNNLNKNNEIIFSYFNQIKKEKIKIGRNSNFSLATHPNYRTSSSFYSKKKKIISPSISSGVTDINNNNFILRNYTATNFKNNQKKKISKSTKKLNSSQKNRSNSSSHIMKSLRSNEYNPQASFQMINLFKNNNNYKKRQIKRNKYYNPKGKEKIQDKYNIYFNCFIPSLYEEQKQKLLNEKNMRQSKSTTKIKKLEDYVGPNLYDEKVESPDFGYICYKTNKKINPKYSLNSNYIYNNYGTLGNINSLNNQHFPLNINLRNIYNDYENNKNNYENENDLINYPNKINNVRNRNDYYKENQNYYKTEYNDELIKEIIYHDLYNKAFKQFNYPSNDNINKNSYNDDIKWKLS